MQCKWARRHEISDDRPKMLILTFWSRDFGVCVTVLGGKFVGNNQKKRWQARWAATQNHTPTTAAAAHASIHTLWWSLWIRNQFPSIHFDAVWFVKFAHAIKCLANLSVFFLIIISKVTGHWTMRKRKIDANKINTVPRWMLNVECFVCVSFDFGHRCTELVSNQKPENGVYWYTQTHSYCGWRIFFVLFLCNNNRPERPTNR